MTYYLRFLEDTYTLRNFCFSKRVSIASTGLSTGPHLPTKAASKSANFGVDHTLRQIIFALSPFLQEVKISFSWAVESGHRVEIARYYEKHFNARIGKGSSLTGFEKAKA